MIHGQPETKIIFVSRFMMTATAIFNGNAFPETANKSSLACANRLAIFLYNIDEIKYALRSSYDDFTSQLILHSNDLIGAANSRADLRFVVYSDGLEYLTSFHSALYSLKSFLDVYARLICLLINPHTDATTFGAKKIDGKQISGGKFLKWIDGNSPSTYENKEILMNVIICHSSKWITEAVNYRDTLAHYRDIENMVDLRLPLENVKNSIDINSVQLPIFINGEGLDTYLERILTNLGLFLDDTISLLPNVDMKLVSSWKECIGYSQKSKQPA
ncbi:MAG: hypothetical protein ACU83V_03905 [Gammaproteobacteria bacterium]